MLSNVLLIITLQGVRNVLGAIENIYGDEFLPSVKASCAGLSMTIRVDTKNPFEGIIHAVDHKSEAGCYEVGRGGLKTFLRLDISTPGACGLQYNAETGDRSVMVAVRAHPSVDLLEDRLFSLSCGRAAAGQTKPDISLVSLSLRDGVRELRAGQAGVSYNLRAELRDPRPNTGLMVRNCLAFNLAGTVITLVDDRGCRPNDNFISEWSYDQSGGRADTTLWTLIQFSATNRTFYQCDVQLCQGECQLPECEGGAATGGQARAGGQIFEDTITGSTTVFVADPSLGSAGALSVDCGIGDDNPSWLRGLTIAFGVLFGIMLLINVFLCSAMTCSCTRTEVIEKEPSVYDDDIYGEYDNKTYSDPGSDEYEDQLRGLPPSEVGTYRSSDRQQPGYLQ